MAIHENLSAQIDDVEAIDNLSDDLDHHVKMLSETVNSCPRSRGSNKFHVENWERSVYHAAQIMKALEEIKTCHTRAQDPE